MHPVDKPLFAKVVMGVLTAILFSACLLGNGFVLAAIARFKSFRTVPNILVANLALVDLFNAAVTIPPYMIYYVFEASWFKGKALGILTVVLNRLFTVLNLASMIVMLTNMYLAISFDLQYFAWKTNRKALLCVFLTWFISIVSVALSSISLFDSVNVGDVHVREYREEVFKEGRLFVMSFMAIFLICAAFLCLLTTQEIKKKQKKVFQSFNVFVIYLHIVFYFVFLDLDHLLSQQTNFCSLYLPLADFCNYLPVSALSLRM